MGLLNKIYSHFKKVGEMGKCPYCKNKLEKVPSRKKKCEFCGKYIYSRTRPSDRKKVLVTENQAREIDKEWQIIMGTRDLVEQEEKEFKRLKKKLRDRFGKEPSDNDVMWAKYNNELLEHGANMDWGLYRNTRFKMGELLRKEGRKNQALLTLLEVCYLDLNGPSNSNKYKDAEMIKKFPPFDPKTGFLAPGVVQIIKSLIKESDMDLSKLKSVYIKHVSRIKNSLKLPLSLEESWGKIKKELQK